MRFSLLLFVPVVATLTACTYGDHHPYYDDDYYDDNYDDSYAGTCGGTARETTIDADAGLDADPGSGVGVFVEYASGGHWHVYATCDTKVHGYDCAFDIIARPSNGSFTNLQAEDLESGDQVSLGGKVVELIATTDYDFDGFYIDTEPGAILRLSAYLGGDCANTYLYWVGDGAVHEGAPAAPLDFSPSAE